MTQSSQFYHTDSIKVEFIVGTGFDLNGAAILPGEAVDFSLASDNILLNLFGGFTRSINAGGWKDGTDTVREQSLVYTVLLTGVLPATQQEHWNKVKFAQDTIRDIFRQKSVVLTTTLCHASFN